MTRQIQGSLLARSPIFRNYLGASTISLIGTSIFDIAMPLYVLQRTNSVMALAMVSVCLHLPHFLMAPITGFTADNFNKRNVMLLSDFGQVLCMIFLLGYDLSGSESIWPVHLTVFVAKSLMLMFETVATFQLIPALVDKDELSAANTWFLSLHRVIQILGPLSGGFLMTAFGVRSCILANIFSFSATLYFTYSLKNIDSLIQPDTPPSEMTLSNMMRSFTDAVRYVWESKLFRPFIVLMFLWNLSPLTLNSPSLTYYFTATHHYNAAQYGTVVAWFGVLGILGFLFSSTIYRRLPFGTAFAKSALVQAILGTLAVCFLPSPFGLAVCYAASRTGSSVLSMGTYFIRQTMVPRNQSGAVNATLRMFFMSAAPLSAFLQGYLIDWYGVGISLFLGAVALWGTYYYARRVSDAFAADPALREVRAA